MGSDGFWSISLYNADGYYQKNDLNAYSLEQHHVEEERTVTGTTGPPCCAKAYPGNAPMAANASAAE